MDGVLIKVRWIKKESRNIRHSTLLATVKNGVKKIQAAAYNGARMVPTFVTKAHE